MCRPVPEVTYNCPPSSPGDFCFSTNFAAMLFQDVIGQTEVKGHLQEMVHQNRISHALLFLGKEGSGALPLAIAFAQFMVCQQVKENPGATDTCGACAPCLKAKPLMHPDIHFSYPVIPKKPGDKPVSTDYMGEWREFISQYPYGNVYDWLQFIGAENKQGNITAQECNDILRKLTLKSWESQFKILILWMPEYLGNEGNKLLKLIEEPPADTLFILVAENESLILPTILSRTQLVRIPVLHTNEVVDALVSRAGTAVEQARQVAPLAEGNYREALQMMRHAEEDWQSLLREWLNAIVKTGPIAQVKWVEEISKLGREKQKQFLRYFNHLLEQAIRLKVLEDKQLPLPANEQDFALRLNKIADFSQQEAIIEELDKATYFIERNANAKMLFHALTIKLYHIISDKQAVLVK
jgi:DNA polymerase III subunit delta'